MIAQDVPIGNRNRERLPTRRASENFEFECNGHAYVATVSRFDDGRLAEIFLNASKGGSSLDAAARDSAVTCSLALQHNVPLNVIRHALLRNPRGTASGALGVALDTVASREAS